MGRRMSLHREVGSRVRSARMFRHMTQTKLAVELGLTRAAISNIEAGKNGVTIDHLYGIANILDIELVVLMPPRDAIGLPGHGKRLRGVG